VVNLADLFEQQLVLLDTWRIETTEPVVVAGSRHIEHPAGHRDINVVVGEFTDQREYYFGRTFSRAKYAAARLRISTSTSRRRLSRRSSASSFFSALVSCVALPDSSISAWATQLRRHDSEIRRSFANSATDLDRSRANSMARRRNSGG